MIQRCASSHNCTRTRCLCVLRNRSAHPGQSAPPSWSLPRLFSQALHRFPGFWLLVLALVQGPHSPQSVIGVTYTSMSKSGLWWGTVPTARPSGDAPTKKNAPGRPLSLSPVVK